MSEVKRSMIATITQGNLEMKSNTGGLPSSMELNFAAFIKGEKGDKGDDGADGADGATGATGATGERGTMWFTGTTYPSDNLCKDGDLFMNTSTYNIYRCNIVTGTSIVEGVPDLSTLSWNYVGCIKQPIPSINTGILVNKVVADQSMVGPLMVNGGTTGAYSEITKNEVSVNEVPFGASDRSFALGFKVENGINKAVLRLNANGTIKEIKVEDIERVVREFDAVKAAVVNAGLM